MKLNALFCPNCGGKITGDLSKQTVFCPYCGQQLAIDHEKNEIEITHRIIDEAKVIRAKSEAELNRRNQRFNRFLSFAESETGSYLLLMLLLIVSLFIIAILDELNIIN